MAQPPGKEKKIREAQEVYDFLLEAYGSGKKISRSAANEAIMMTQGYTSWNGQRDVLRVMRSYGMLEFDDDNNGRRGSPIKLVAPAEVLKKLRSLASVA